MSSPGRRLLLCFCLVIGANTPAQAQDLPSGIRLAGVYNIQRHILAVRPIESATDATIADTITAMLRRDVRYSERLLTLDVIPESLTGGTINYQAWSALNVVYLVTGALQRVGAEYELSLAVHDVVYGRILRERTYRLPRADARDFRLAVHAIADDIGTITVGQSFGAASRITFVQKLNDTRYALIVIDTDGFGATRVHSTAERLYSPAWSPDARRIAFLQSDDAAARWELLEYDVASGATRRLGVPGEMLMTPTYAPDGNTLTFAVWSNDGANVVSYDLQRSCCQRRITGEPRSTSLAPSYSADGSRIAFQSDRVGRQAIHLMTSDGASVSMLSPYVHGQTSHYAAPAWSPAGNLIAFNGHWSKYGADQLFIADATQPSADAVIITDGGNNEDPSWGPDARKLVYVHDGDAPAGLYVIDSATRARRLLHAGTGMRTPEWSRSLLRAETLTRSSEVR